MRGNFVINDKLKKPLSKIEEAKYFELLNNGDKNARNILFDYNLRLVFFIINRFYASMNYNKEDLFQTGCIGLLKAIDKFKLDYGYRFSTYAFPMIYGKINRSLKDDDLIKITKNDKNIIYKIIKLIKNHRDLEYSEIAELLNIDEEIIKLVVYTKNIYSLSSKPLEVNISELWIDNLVEKEDLKTLINKAFSMIDEREQTVIKLLYGFNGEAKKLRQVADLLGISRTLVMRINRKAISKLSLILKQLDEKDEIVELKYRKSKQEI